ncbi:endonuclease [Corallococcus sp. H22C18031201]|uniref:endonuclease/exonuclease/phosphatase family protein n=1 Tax=Citreicoccus inhibens TaxID=2849499 RepID=UPI000E70B823|nr:endonuclease/exonuclease/phosphatase family protein [Citreicoccus inhibens]MBU8900556.1 endonuclease/exonuclease/phosphatase family protein [Citreicoccus inhibens]RJS26918.1 endonuclease [Corallococcus sp. H22C18031201]
MELTLVSYNIHSGIGLDGVFDLARVGQVLREVNADILALQEVGDFRGQTPCEDQPEHLAELLGMHLAFGPNVVLNGRRYGNAILTRLPICRSKNYDLSVPRREPRGALRCDLDLGAGQLLHVFSLHMGLSVGERRRQEALLLSADILRDAVRKDPVVVCGDFNSWGPGPVPALVRRALHDTALALRVPARTYPTRWPLLRLDRIYVDAGVKPLALHPHRTPLSRRASDHLPLVLRFQAPIVVATPRSPPVQLIG